MADVMSHGGDGAGDPPRGPAHILSGSCQAAPPPKRRSISRSQNLEKIWRENGMRPLHIDFDTINGTWQPVGPYQKYCTRLIGNQVRFNVIPCYKDWAKVPKEDRDRIRAMIETYFDVRGERSNIDYQMALGALDRLAADRYRAYKTNVHKYYQENGPSRPFGELSAEQWQRCIDFFTTSAFIDRSKKNKVNRTLTKYPSVQGSRSFSASRFEKIDPLTKQLPSPIDCFKEFHTFKSGNWVNTNAADDYDHLCEVRETQQTLPSSGPIDERAIIREVLGTRRGHERGIGRIPKGAATSVNSTARSHVPPGSTCTNDPRLEAYDARIRQLEMTIARLTQNTQLSDDVSNDDEEDGPNGLEES